MPETPSTCFIGGGNMARALIGGLLRGGWPPERITVGEPQAALRAALQRDFAIRTAADNRHACAGAEVLVLAVKPQVIDPVLAELVEPVRASAPLVLSIAAGIPLARLERGLAGHTRLVRAMPNTPALIGAGISALYAAAQVAAADRQCAERILGAAGDCLWLAEERQMDLVTAVSGSGPAYVFLLLEAMQAAATARGLDPAIARRLVARTVLGAARMVQDEQSDFARERARVTSPGGTTAAALAVLEAEAWGAILDRAIGAAAARAAELGGT